MWIACCRLVFDGSPVSPVKVEVVETEYQPINSRRKGTPDQVLLAVKHHVNERKGHGKEKHNPSLVFVLVKTYGRQFLLSVFYKVPSDLLVFANPLILK